MPAGSSPEQHHGPALAAQVVLVGLRGQDRQQPLGQLAGRLDGHRHPPAELQLAQRGHVALHGPDPGPGRGGRRRPGRRGRGRGLGRGGPRRRPGGGRRRPLGAGGEHHPADGQPDHHQQDQRRRQPPDPPPARRLRRRRGRASSPRAAGPVGGCWSQDGRSVSFRARGGGLCLPVRAAGRVGHDAGSPARDSTSSWVRRRNERRGRSRSSTATSRRELPVSPAGAAWRSTRMASCRAASSSMSSS